MKSHLHTLALAAALGSALPAAHAQPAKAGGTVPPVLDAMRSAARELQRADDTRLPCAVALSKICSTIRRLS